ncbi:polynucleotide kinase-phosphatase [Gemmata sp. SH-PL17]|uniref:polynucleotide kinase-phosphatase n=1 Tax=Gemmata sp. SH-PL17 TaxID=1630693 RepID=UPI001EF74FA0|nr:polynucleotide kinase-phosphatase [Gemmata sp. SH-PL17]
MTIRIPEFALVLMVGPSGSGKSTFARKHFKPTEILSSDFFRGLLSDDEMNQAASDDAFEVLHLICAKRLARGKLTVIDATNVRPESRKPLLEMARKYHVQMTAVAFNFSADVCHARNQQRAVERPFGPHVTQRHAEDLRRSLARLEDEGIRRVYVLNSEEEVAAVTFERYRLPVNKRDERGPFDIIGDVHGCLNELLALLTKLGYALTQSEDGWRVTPPEGRRLVFVGDLCDRGPDTPGVYRLVMDAVQRGIAFCVLGNHEDKLLRWMKTPDKVKQNHGLAQSVEQFEKEPPELRTRVQEFIAKLPSHLVLDGGRLVVAHAGLTADMHGRVSGKVRAFAIYGDTTGESDEFGLPVRLNWAANYRARANVVYGHTPVLTPAWENRCICIDTGCVFGGALTALRYPEQELVSVPAEKQYAESKRPLGGEPNPLTPFPRKEGGTESEAVLSPSPLGGGVGEGLQTEPTSERGDGGVGRLHSSDLDIADVIGRRNIETRFAGKITIREENAAAALEVMSRFAADPRWLIYLPPTMSPCEASALPDFLEHPAEAFRYYKQEGAERVVCEQKHMGSRAVIIVCKDEAAAARRFGVNNESGIVYTRTGRRFFDDTATESAFLALVRDALTAADWWTKFNTDWVALDGELMPWSAKAQELLRRQYAATGSAATAALAEVNKLLANTADPSPTPPLSGEGLKTFDGSAPPSFPGKGVGGLGRAALTARFGAKAEAVERFVASYRRYCWSVNSVTDLKFAPFFLLATEGKLYFDRTHDWHMRTLAELCARPTPPSPLPEGKGEPAHDPAVSGAASTDNSFSPFPGRRGLQGEPIGGSPSQGARGDGVGILHATPYRVVDLADAGEVESATQWWLDLTNAGDEGMVVKPLEVLTKGRRFFVQPALKVRGREYLRIIYGPDYLAAEHLSRLKHRAVGAKRGLAAREFGLGLEGLERFARSAPLREVHECVFAVLALESEPIDPRL